MALLTLATPFFEQMVNTFVSNAGSTTGSKGYMVAPFRGKITEVGFMPSSLSSAVAWTFQVDIGDNFSSQTVSNFTTVVSSTLGTFTSQQTFEGAICSVIPTTQAFVNRGDAIRCINSGGATSVIGATVYAVVRRM